MDKSEQKEKLFIKYIENTIDNKELEELVAYLNLDENRSQFEELLESYYKNDNQFFTYEPHENTNNIVDDAWKKIDLNLTRQTSDLVFRKSNYMRRMYKYAAAILIFFSCTVIWYYFQYQGSKSTIPVVHDIQAGSNRASLTLSDGTTIDLSESKSTIVLHDQVVSYRDGTPILKTEGIQIATLATPRAGQYQVVLPDGSKVWLNASTTLKYPTQFSDQERRVELDGEAYFEIKESTRKDKNGRANKIPFIVETREQNVVVLGTQFNISAYKDEKTTRTTLVDGSVQVQSKSSPHLDNMDRKTMLQPGQQSSLAKNQITIHEVNTVQFTSWKDGIIVLDKQSIEEVLKQLERWYDVQFFFVKDFRFPNKTLSGEVLRSLSLLTFLDALEEQTNLKFEIKERRILVKNNT